MNSYNFPEHVPVSDSAKNIITKILNHELSKRPSIIAYPFMIIGGILSKVIKTLIRFFLIKNLVLPSSTLACPQSASYIK